MSTGDNPETTQKHSSDKKATIYDLARKAGVSAGTASRALNQIGYVREATRLKVEAAAAALKYSPNRAARTLKTNRTGLIALAIPDTDNPFYVEMVQAVLDVARKNAYSLILYYTGGDSIEEIKALKMLQEKYADGCIMVNFYLTPKHLHEIERANIPIVLSSISRSEWGGTENDHFDYIGVDVEKGIYLAVRHLTQQGHARIGYVAGPSGLHLFQERFDGYCRALRDSGISYVEERVCWCDYTENCGYEMAGRLMAVAEPPTAIVCANDILVHGVMRKLAELDVQVPCTVAVVGMDDIPLDRLIRPSLSSVNLTQAEIGRQAAELIFQRLRGELLPPSVKKILEPRLVVRNSSIIFSNDCK